MSDIPRRKLGKTDQDVSIVGLGGHHIGMPHISEDSAISIIRTAIDEGVTFMDNNWGYHEGRSEELMGKALQDGYRDKVFLMTKVDARTKSGALEQLDESLRRLKTDYVDLWQIHEVVYYNDPDLISAPDGAIAALDVAKEQGKVRFVGFTGHKDPALHLRTLNLYDFDTMQMPLNVMDHHFMSFEQHVLPVALSRDVGVIGMKSYGDARIIESGVVTPCEALSYTLSLPISTCIKGIESIDDLNNVLDIVRGFEQLSHEEMEAIVAKTAPLEISGDGRYELYKTSMKHEANPGRKAHGFPTMEEVGV